MIIYKLIFFSLILAPAFFESNTKKRPNIILYLADDLGYGEFGFLNKKMNSTNAPIETPFIDEIASKSAVFLQGYTGSPVCAPSRCSLLTGYHTGHATIRGNFKMPNDHDLPLKPFPHDLTIADVLRPLGYTSAIIGKWCMGFNDTSGSPYNKSFDYSFGHLD